MGKIVPLTANLDHQYENDNTPIMTQHQGSNTSSSGRPAARALRSAPIPTLPPTSPVHPGFQQGDGPMGRGGPGGGPNARRYNTTHHGHRHGGGGGGGGGRSRPPPQQQQQQYQQQYPPSPSYNSSYNNGSHYPTSPSSPSFSNYPPTPTTPLPAYQEINMHVERPSPVAQPPQYTSRNMVYPGGHGNGSATHLNGYGHRQQYQQQQQQQQPYRNDSRYQSPYRSNSGDVGYAPKRTASNHNNSGAYYPMQRTGTTHQHQRQRPMRDDDDRVGESWLCCKEVASFCPCCCFCCIFAGMGVSG